MSVFFEIADISYELENVSMDMVTDDIGHFMKCTPSDGFFRILCHIQKVDNYTPIQGDIILQEPYRIVLSENGIEKRIFFMNPFSAIYGVSTEISDHELFIETDQIIIDRRFLEVLSFEKHLLRRNAFILHSCYVRYNNKGIAFTAPSGTGKSTQGDLWEKYGQGEVVNGDRSILQFTKGEWVIHSLPFCGSSFINKNISLPLEKVAFVIRDASNRVEAGLIDEDFPGIMNEVTVNTWDYEAIMKAAELVKELIASGKAVKLYCTPEKEACLCLKEYLYHD